MSAGRGIRTAVLVVVALVLGGVAVATAPDDEQIVGPIPTTANLGEKAVTRQFDAEVHSVQLVDELDVSYGSSSLLFVNALLPTDGVWVVVDLTVTARYALLQLAYSELRIDGVTYRASSLLPSPTVSSNRFGPGMPVRGPMVFEIPREVAESDAAAHAVIELKAELTPQVEGVTQHPVDLTARERLPRIVLNEADLDEDF